AQGARPLKRTFRLQRDGSLRAQAELVARPVGDAMDPGPLTVDPPTLWKNLTASRIDVVAVTHLPHPGRSPEWPQQHHALEALGARLLHRDGAVAVLTGADLVADGLKPMSHRPVPTNPYEVPLKSPDGAPFFVSDPLPLPVDRARFVGEPVAMVVAETALAARDGAERVTVEWEPL